MSENSLRKKILQMLSKCYSCGVFVNVKIVTIQIYTDKSHFMNLNKINNKPNFETKKFFETFICLFSKNLYV